jgi:hypothetical protein
MSGFIVFGTLNAMKTEHLIYCNCTLYKIVRNANGTQTGNHRETIVKQTPSKCRANAEQMPSKRQT